MWYTLVICGKSPRPVIKLAHRSIVKHNNQQWNLFYSDVISNVWIVSTFVYHSILPAYNSYFPARHFVFPASYSVLPASKRNFAASLSYFAASRTVLPALHSVFPSYAGSIEHDAGMSAYDAVSWKIRNGRLLFFDGNIQYDCAWIDSIGELSVTRFAIWFKSPIERSFVSKLLTHTAKKTD